MENQRNRAIQAKKPANTTAQFRALASLRIHWRPTPLKAPQVADDLEDLPVVQRAAAVVHHSVLRMEYWLAPQGFLREWVRWNLRVALTIGIPALLIVRMISYLLGQFATWTELLVRIISHLLVFPLAFIAVMAFASASLFILQSFLLSVRRQGSPEQEPRDQDGHA